MGESLRERFSDMLSLALLQPGAVVSKWAENSAAASTWQCPGAMLECRNSGWGEVLTEQTSAGRDLTPCPTSPAVLGLGDFPILKMMLKICLVEQQQIDVTERDS